MDKNKRLFPFRKHPVGDIFGGKGKKVKRGMGILLSAALLFNTLPSGWLTAAASQDSGTGLCEHHMEHTADCGYQEADPGAECSHEHTEECYKIVKNCIHEHMESCYPEETSGEKEASSSNAGEKQPLECSHVCSEENGCITKETDCIHEHDESCGYREETSGSPCAFECAVCSSETLEETDSETKTSETETEEEGKEPDSGQTEETDSGQECICGELCKEGSINPDCPVCSAEGADLSVCEGTAYEDREKEEETTEVTEPEEAEPEATNLCAHHKEHTEDCGFVPATEDSEGSPCTYECRICPIEDLIAALPDEVTADNAEDVRAQLEEILSLFSELTDEEQEQIDLSHCYEMQGALDEANEPVLAVETSGDFGAGNAFHWSISEDGTLTITGTGDMPDFQYANDPPWFNYWKTISKVEVQEGVTSIGKLSFYTYGNLSHVDLPDSLTSIGDNAFHNCGLTMVTIPDNVTTIGKEAFYGCDGLTEIIIPDNVTAIGERAFVYCDGLTEITIPDNVTTIGMEAFYGCNGLTKVIFEHTIAPELGENVFGETNVSLQIVVPAGATGYDGENWPADKVVVPVAKVVKQDGTTTYVADLADAFADANSGATVTMLVDVELAKTVDIPADTTFVLDLNGYTISNKQGTCIGTATGSNLTIRDSGTGGTVTSAKAAVYVNGTIKLEGGRFLTNAPDAWGGVRVIKWIGNSLTVTGEDVYTNSLVIDDVVASLAAGTYDKILIDSARTFEDFLAEDHAYYKGSQPLALDGLGVKSENGMFLVLTDSVTVGKCSHPDSLSDNGDGTHGGTCPFCGKVFAEEFHTPGTDNKCTGCGTELVAKVESGSTIYVGSLEDAFDSINTSATVTLLADVTLEESVDIPSGTFTLDLSGKNVSAPGTALEMLDSRTTLDIQDSSAGKTGTIQGGLSAGNWAGIELRGGTLNIIGGTIQGTWAGVEISSIANTELNVSGDAVLKCTEGMGLFVNSFSSGNEKIWLSGGTFTGGQRAISAKSTQTLKELLVEGYAYANGDTLIVEGLESNSFTFKSVTVRKCDHTGEGVCEYTHIDGTTTHSMTCLACGYTATMKCTYDENKTVSNDDNTHTLTCSGCAANKTEDCSGGTATYTEKAKCEICEGEYGELIKDTEKPTGEISIRTNKWNSFLNTITFGLFFKQTEQVTITAEDKESGVKSVSYYISDSGMSKEEVEALTVGWTDVENDTVTFSINEDKSCVIYVKITDHQGNVTYLSSDGVVFDGTAPSIGGVENGKTYCKPQIVTVRDENLESVTVNGKEQTLSDDSFTLGISFDVPTIVIEAADKAENITTVTINTGHDYGTDWKSDGNGHWRECACGDKSETIAHTEDSGSVTKPATETETGIRTYKCSVCGYVIRTEEIEKLSPSHKHSYGTDWKSDKSNHWHECACGDKSDTAAHTEDSGSVTKPATETETGIRTYKCSVCGYVIRTEEIEKLSPSHKHSYGTDWKSDKSNHWHECACGDKSDTAAHTEDSGSVTKPATETETGIRTYKCSVCGYVIRTEEIEKLSPSHKHSYGTDWKSDKSNHWHECACGDKSDTAAHTEDSGSVTKPATETETGIRTYKCSVCGYVIRTEEIEKLSPSHKHSYGTDWKSDKSNHWHECACGDRSGESAHTEDSGSVTKAPTETEKGVRTYRCSVCGYVMRTEEIAKLPVSHTHSYGTSWKSDSNNHWHECACGDRSGESAHTEDSGSVTKAPTETEKGIRTYRCSVCGYVMRTEEIAKLPVSHTHSYGTSWKSDSNNHWHECACGDRSGESAHTEDSGSVTKAPTETEKGIRTYKCSVCGYVIRTEEIGKLPPSHKHSYGTGWKSDGNKHWRECACGDRSGESAHTEDSGSVTKAPTETEKGVRTYRCSVCGYVMRTEEIAKLSPSHTESNQPGDKKPDNNQSENHGTDERPDRVKPEISSTGEDKPEAGKPFIKDKSGQEGTAVKSGWKVIREETSQAEDGKTVIVDMNGSTVVPGDVLENIRGRDITIVFDMGNGMTWSVNGKDIREGKISDIDFSVQTDTEKIPVDIVNHVTGENYSIQISLAHEGEFGFTAVLSISLGKENAGLTASLYYYKESTGELEFICTDTIAEDGTVSLAFPHASDYVITVDAKQEEENDITEVPKTGDESPQTDAADIKVENDLWNRIWIFVVCGVLVIAGLGIFLVRRKNNSKSS